MTIPNGFQLRILLKWCRKVGFIGQPCEILVYVFDNAPTSGLWFAVVTIPNGFQSRIVLKWCRKVGFISQPCEILVYVFDNAPNSGL